MKKANKKEEVKLIKQTNEDTNVVRKFFLILLGVILICGLIYLLTTKTLSDTPKSAESSSTSISYDNVNVGNIFNRPYEEYYVMAYDFDASNAYEYTNAVLAYKNESTSIKIYSLDLGLKQNNDHVGDKSNKNAKTASEVVFNGPTLIKITDGKIKNYYDTKEEILNALK